MKPTQCLCECRSSVSVLLEISCARNEFCTITPQEQHHSMLIRSWKRRFAVWALYPSEHTFLVCQSSAIMMQYKLQNGHGRKMSKPRPVFSLVFSESLVCFERQNLVPFLVLTTRTLPGRFRLQEDAGARQFWRELARFV